MFDDLSAVDEVKRIVVKGPRKDRQIMNDRRAKSRMLVNRDDVFAFQRSPSTAYVEDPGVSVNFPLATNIFWVRGDVLIWTRTGHWMLKVS
jgi:hypothetical protein